MDGYPVQVHAYIHTHTIVGRTTDRRRVTQICASHLPPGDLKNLPCVYLRRRRNPYSNLFPAAVGRSTCRWSVHLRRLRSARRPRYEEKRFSDWVTLKEIRTHRRRWKKKRKELFRRRRRRSIEGAARQRAEADNNQDSCNCTSRRKTDWERDRKHFFFPRLCFRMYDSTMYAVSA